MSAAWEERGTSAKNLEVRSKGASVFLQVHAMCVSGFGSGGAWRQRAFRGGAQQ